MQTRTFRWIASLSLAALAAGCQSSGSNGLMGSGGKSKVAAAQPEATTPIVRGSCPKVELRQGTAYYRTYARGGKKERDPSKVITQVSLDETTRKCTLDGNQITMHVAVAGRAVSGPQGGPGPVSMPIRVAVVDGSGKVLYSQLTKYSTDIPKGAGSNQFLFTKNVPLALDNAGDARVFVGFDEGSPKSR